MTGAPRDNFSIFLLRLQWAPDWCCGSDAHYCTPNGIETEIADGTSDVEVIDGNRLLLHGLWPEWNDLTGNRTAADPLDNSTLLQNLYWPQYCDGAGNYTFSSCCIPTHGGGCHDSASNDCKIPAETRVWMRTGAKRGDSSSRS